MTNAEKLTPVSTKFAKIHVLVEIMLSVECLNTNQSVPARRDTRAIQMLPVSRLSVG